jgi:hypothetical protein
LHRFWWPAALACVPLQLPGQGVLVTGEIRHGGQAPRPLAAQWAVLHEIRPDTGAPVDSARTDAVGRYRLTLPGLDSTAVYYIVTTYQDVEYFSAIQPVRGRARVDAEPLLVYDTTTGGPPMRVERRLLTLLRPGEEGGAGTTVVDIVEVVNPGTRTRIARDSLHPVWTMVLPPGARDWHATAGNLVPQAIWLRGDTVQVFAPIWPGAPLRMSHRYALPGSPVRLSLDQPTAALVVLLDDTTATVSGANLQFAGMRESEGGGGGGGAGGGGARFAAYSAGPSAAGAQVFVTFSRRPLTPAQLLPYVVGVAGLGFVWALWVAFRRKPLPRR